MQTLFKQLEEITKCPVCLGVLRVPLWHCANGHSICRQCRVGVMACPTCRAGFTNIKSVILESVLSMLPRECKYSNFGCNRKLLSDNLEEHESLCPMRNVSCRFPSCPWQDKANKLFQHYKEKHADKKKNNGVYEFAWKQKQPIENTESLTAVEEFGNVLYIYLKIDTVKGKFLTFTICVPTSDEIFQELYSVTTFKNTNSSIGYQYSQKVFKESVDPQKIYSNEKCMTVPLSELSRFIDEYSKLRFSYDIVKI